MADRCDQGGPAWWTLGQAVDWIRETDPAASIADIRIALEHRCASGRIGAGGHRRYYASDAAVPLDPQKLEFVWFSDQHGRLEQYFDEISAREWSDLAFFARARLVPGEQSRVSLTRALDRSDAPVELRSRSKHRLAWSDVEFRRSDVIREWPGPGGELDCLKLRNETPRPEIRGVAQPISDAHLRRWYEKRVKTLTAQARTSSGEEDWAAAKDQFPNRVTRSRVRSIREKYAPDAWRKQGRRAQKRTT